MTASNIADNYCKKNLVVCAESNNFETAAHQLADQLKLTIVNYNEAILNESLLLVCVATNGIGLKPAGKKQNPVVVDFVGGVIKHRTRGAGKGAELIAKAVGVKGKALPYVLDATAGLGRDAFVLASLGCKVLMLEKHPVIAAMLRDGMQRASCNETTVMVVNRMNLCVVDAWNWLKNFDKLNYEQPEVVYLDPMFPARNKSAKVKKDMQVLHQLFANSKDSSDLLEIALTVASKRVVVKRPAKAEPLQGKQPNFVIMGKSNRFDVYLVDFRTNNK